MSLELTMLLWSVVLAGAYLIIQSSLYRLDYGVLHAATARDNDRQAGVLTGRGERALRNFLETYAIFVALVMVIELGHRSDALTVWGTQIWFWARWAYLPAYLVAIPFVRSAIWVVSAIGLAMMLCGAMF